MSELSNRSKNTKLLDFNHFFGEFNTHNGEFRMCSLYFNNISCYLTEKMENFLSQNG